jgi:hypothetical protein
MEALVTATAAPLYGMCQPIALGPIPPGDWVLYLTSRASAGRKPFRDDHALSRVLDLAGPIPSDIQQLAYTSFDVADRQIDTAAVDTGLRRLVTLEANTYTERFEALSAGQRRVLARLATEPEAQLGAQSFAIAAGLANATSVRKALDALASEEIVVRRDGTWRIDDPFLAAWLRAP